MLLFEEIALLSPSLVIEFVCNPPLVIPLGFEELETDVTPTEGFIVELLFGNDDKVPTPPLLLFFTF